MLDFSVEMYGAWRSGSAWTERVPRRDTKDKRGRSASICVLIGVRGRGGGTPLRLDWMWPLWDPVLKRGPTGSHSGFALTRFTAAQDKKISSEELDLDLFRTTVRSIF